MPLGTVLAYLFPVFAALALGVLFWADCLEEQDRRRVKVNRFFASLN